MHKEKQKGGNKFFNVFVGEPWTSNINTWPGISTNNDGTTISNYFKNPLPVIDPPNFAPQTPGGWTIVGGKRKTSRKPRKYQKSIKLRKYKKSRKSRKSKKSRKL
jgi:hypothetical protein